MKIFSYNFDIAYGNGQGIVFAENKKDAIEIIKQNDGYYQENLKYESSHEIIIEEIKIETGSIISFSYTE